MARRSSRKRWLSGLRNTAAALIGLAWLVPLLWMFLSSVSNDADVYRVPPKLWPAWNWGNYARAWAARPWPRYFANTLIIALSVVAFTLVTSILAGFAFALMRFRGSKTLFYVVMSVMMVPQTVLLIPNFILAHTTGLYDTYWIQILPWAASVFGIFLLRQTLSALPTEIFEAAELDGAGPVSMLVRIAAPLAVPSLILIGLNTFMGSWSSFVWPYLMTQNDTVRPIEVGLQAFYGAEGTDWTGLSAAVTFTTLPVVILFFSLQKYFVQGAFSTQGAVQ
ncbi:multiple sugar transport system permease protein [Propionibacterium cyclohexanicum]|uniref:Multiple sugar transport system permease protein n=1 Tax=Propionibacterium cyclohexanicum TaxID=64702 RepID=A0A1H9TWK9_9ACTN|nr:carbohydrate ABC transporter permease [Propionibacterium cyclohexanicum]SES01388.1 multiple sugar transport system permease protein [Propionibacterium cyclohexanicum]